MEASEFPLELQTKAFQILTSKDNTPIETLFSHIYASQHQNEHSLRSHALAFLQCCKHHHPDLLLIKLFFLFRTDALPETRANVARALHFLKAAEFWPKLKPIAQGHLKVHFLAYLAKESSLYVLRLVSLLLAEILSVTYKTHQNWPEALDLLTSFIASDNDNCREFASLVFKNLPNDSRFPVSSALEEKNDTVRVLHASFFKFLASSNRDVQVASFGAVVSLVRLFSEPPVFHDLLRAIMVGVFTLLHSFEGSYFRSAFAELINLVSQEPLLLKPYMNDMVLDVLQIAESESLSEETHCLAFQLVVVMTEVKEYEHVFVNLPHETVRRLFFVPIKMLRYVAEDGCDGKREMEIEKAGMKGLKKLSAALGASKVVPLACEVFLLQLDNEEWRVRRAGITMLSVIAEDFSDEMVMTVSFIGEVVRKVLESMEDSHAQVRMATFKFMLTSSNFVQGVQLLYHHRFVHVFCNALDNEQDLHVKEQAGLAMQFFLKNTLPESITLNENADTVMGKFLPLLQDKSSKLKSIALSTLNVVLQRCEEVAHKYRAIYLPMLLEACTDENSTIREEATLGIKICVELGTPQLKPLS
ncbi:hypothetical protein LR48_Vigan03g262500 [Vigna angularis]|uniref:IPO4/5-like TPR repeats domain-containing protein n=2 Tax=Phaseolus angularis TaxID=3914 RepID=A0A0L9U8X8_PHAAN|nr:uncharacterized protein HKW66_Vig0056370 [Vigna angularis]KOM39243.1 hypothetical protein LR48_Vigan03g262500 [Vigna angularis]